MPTFLAIVAASTVGLLIEFGMPGIESVWLKAVLQLIAWVVVFYYVKRIIDDVRP
jgi:hypothetical protein